MRQGVPGFIPERLTEAREARGLTQVALAQLMEKTSSASISRWECADQLPEMSALESLSRVLNLPTAYFMRPMTDNGTAPYFYRSMAATTKAAREKARARLLWAQEISLLLQEYVDLTACDIPDFSLGKDFKTLEVAEIERIASECRKHWKLGNGPISDVHLLLENHGINIVHDEVGSGSMDGLSVWSNTDNRGYIYVAIDKPSAVRCRFNAAHELAHLILHRHINQEALSKGEDFKEIEMQANIFAAAFLMPAESFVAELPAPTLNGFLSLKERWKVSVGAMIMRCQALGMIDEDYTSRLWRHYGARSWRKNEPFDDMFEMEYPRLMRRSIFALVDQGGWSAQNILASLPFASGDIERLANLPGSYLSNGVENFTAMPKLKAKSSLKGEAEIIPFRQRASS